MAFNTVSKRFIEALKTAWGSSNLGGTFTGGYFDGLPPEGNDTKRPYLMIPVMDEPKNTYTNMGEYSQLNFEIDMVADTKEEIAGTLYTAAVTGLNTVATALADNQRVTLINQNNLRFSEVLNYWVGACDFTITIGQPR